MSLSSDLSIRVHTLMAKTRSKLSLNKPRPTLKYFYFLSFLSRFENNFTQFKQLKTFVSS